jgi:lipopolysaccharide heptosyltransferase II
MVKKTTSGILIFEPDWLGDILFTFPFIKTLRFAFPDTAISCIVSPNFAELLTNNPWTDNIYILSNRNTVRSYMALLQLVHRIRKKDYGMCFFQTFSKRRALLAKMANIKERVGFVSIPGSLTLRIPAPPPDIHMIDQILHLTKSMGLKPDSTSYEYFISDNDLNQAHNLLVSRGWGMRKLVTLNPGAKWDGKRWPSDYFCDLGRRILQRFTDFEIILTGDNRDLPIAEKIAHKLSTSKCHNLAGKTDLNQLAAIFKMCSLVISCDTGPLHLASAVGANTIGLFGPTFPEVTGPRGTGVNIVIREMVEGKPYCKFETRHPSKSMRAISPQKVFGEVCKVLSL